MSFSRSSARRRAPVVAGSLLALLAFRDFLRFEPQRPLPQSVERLLFEPADTAPAVVVALVLWLVWRRRERWRRLPMRAGPRWLSLPLLAAGAAIAAWARLTGAADLLAFGALAAGLGLAASFKGPAGLRLLSLPALFLLFAVPLPGALANAVIFRFQLWTAELAGRLLFALGMPAYVAGDMIHRADFAFSVIEGCSGLRSVLTLGMLALLMADLFRRPRRHALLLLAAAPLVGFGLNAVRAVALIVNPHSAIAEVHVAQGVAILLCGVLVLYALDGLLARLACLRSRPSAPAAVAGAPARETPSRATVSGAVGYLALLAAVSLAVPPWIAIDPLPVGLETRFAERLGGWRGAPDALDPLFLGSVSFRESVAARYQQGGEQVELFVGVGDRAHRAASPLSAKTERLGTGWVVEERAATRLGSAAREVDALIERSGTRWRLVYHWVEASAGMPCEALRSLLALDASPWRRGVDPVVVRLATVLETPSASGRRAARERLERFAAVVEPELERLLRYMEGMSRSARRKGVS